MLHSPEVEAKFQRLVSKKWTISIILTVLMLGIYFGFILVLAFNKALLTQKVSESMTLGIPVGVGVILAAFALTGVYVAWANSDYDSSVKEILDDMKK